MTEQEEQAEQPTSSAPRRVVVAEDESLIRLDIVEILRDNGFDVVGEAGDGETAVALATELRPDLVIMDVKMPQLDGISAAEKLHKGNIAPVVLLTAFSQKELVERASEAGALAYVVKPFTPNDLLPAIEIALARHEQIITLEAEVADMVERFETRKLVDRAKGLLNEKSPRRSSSSSHPRSSGECRDPPARYRARAAPRPSRRRGSTFEGVPVEPGASRTMGAHP
ncbi:MAG: transcriptional regulator [Microbacterium sp.]|uniref:ANTAR domain-containing response regulator n=1 Tax=Microbacterium sp. TaxID=51671 RepID=UPI00260A65EB|nr:response regulator [Microbacterium sp.]MDF2561056.1 transcriptional regulator [Microbacterium sp.]